MTESIFFGTDICHEFPFTFDIVIHGKGQGMFRATDSNGPGCDAVGVSNTG